MTTGLLDGRYRINITPGIRVMIQEDGARSLTPCHVKEILTQDVMNELGIKVLCEDGKIGRVKHIGTETTFMESSELIATLERKLRTLIVKELSKDDRRWWENKIQPNIQERVKDARQKNITNKKILQIPSYNLVEELYFLELSIILLAKRNWKHNFEKIFHDSNALKVKLSEMASCRNLYAHAKPLSAHLKRKIQVYYDDIIILVETYERNQLSE